MLSCFQSCNALIVYARHQLAKGIVFHFPFLFTVPGFPDSADFAVATQFPLASCFMIFKYS